jgi:hypothetical protein
MAHGGRGAAALCCGRSRRFHLERHDDDASLPALMTSGDARWGFLP